MIFKEEAEWHGTQSRVWIIADIAEVFTQRHQQLLFTQQLCNTERKGNALFNDALNTFYLQLYGVGHMVKDHSDSERGNLLPVTEETSFINITILYSLISTNEKCKERGKERKCFI